MNELITVGILLAALVGGLLAFAPRVSELLVRSKARRLPPTLSARMGEEWLAELGALPGRPSQIAFAIALTLTRRQSFAIDEESLFAAPTRSPLSVATFGGWPSVVLFTTVVVAAIAYGASFLIEPLYRSHTRILVVQQRVPVRFVESGVRTPLDERMRELRLSVLSRARLERTILEFGLYRSDRGLRASERANVAKGGDPKAADSPRITDAVIDRMRQDLRVDVLADGEFQVAYTSPHPRMAMLVTERVAGLFIEGNREDRYYTHESASQFLDAQIKQVRSRLLEHTRITNLSPTTPSELEVRALEHESLKGTYRDLLMKKEQARRSEGLQRAQIGEQFKIVDGARLPEAPISPDRPRLTILGAVIGFCLGVAMMMAGRDGSFSRSKKMVAQA